MLDYSVALARLVLGVGVLGGAGGPQVFMWFYGQGVSLEGIVVFFGRALSAVGIAQVYGLAFGLVARLHNVFWNGLGRVPAGCG